MNHNRSRQLWVGAGIVVLVVLSFAVGVGVGEKNRPDELAVTTLENKDSGKPAQIDFSPFWKAWNILNEKYVSSATSTSDQDKVWGAIQGLASSLKDPYTVFFPPENAKLFQSEIQGSFEGIGMEIGIKNGVLTVVAPLKGTPAARAGILPADQILKIDDTVTSGMSTDEAIKRIRGAKGTIVRLTLAREGKKEPFEVKVTRDTIEIPTIDTELKPQATAGADGGTGLQQNGVFVIRLYSFSANAANLFRSALRQFIESGSNKLILDLRGNPGGYLEVAVDMASWFLPVGETIVTEDFGKTKPPQVYRSKGYDVFNKNLKFVILVNGGSASASEILSGALKEYGVAKLVGTKTFGKGSVQELVDITPDTALKVTVARWLTPKGVSISEKGIEPDVNVPLTADDLAKNRDPQMDKAIELLQQSPFLETRSVRL